MTGSSTSSKATTCRSRIVHPPPTIANRARLFVNDRRVVRLTLTPSAVIIAITAIAVGGRDLNRRRIGSPTKGDQCEKSGRRRSEIIREIRDGIT